MNSKIAAVIGRSVTEKNGNSGAGSYGRLASFKARVLNEIVKEERIETVIEFGCGDGNQLTLINYPKYTGYDVSETSVELCKRKFAEDDSKQFRHMSEFGSDEADLTLSLDVIYHLIEDDVFEKYISHLFSASRNFVVIYSSNCDDLSSDAPHVKHRKFTDWVKANAPGFAFVGCIKNEYPYDERDPDDTSFSDFYFFKKI